VSAGNEVSKRRKAQVEQSDLGAAVQLLLLLLLLLLHGRRLAAVSFSTRGGPLQASAADRLIYQNVSVVH